MRKWLPVMAAAIALILGGAYYIHPDKVGNDAEIIIHPKLTDTHMRIESTAFMHNGKIPPKYTCDGEDMSPPLTWSGVPEAAKSLVLIVVDTDVPKTLRPEGTFDHWVLFNIPPTASGIPESGEVGVGGNNDAGSWAYKGPCPPTQHEPSSHRYFFKLYALDRMLDLGRGASRREVEALMKDHVLAEAEVMGHYSRKH